MAVPLETCFALLLALLLNWVGPSARAFRLYYLPKMAPAVATARAFNLIAVPFLKT